MDYTTRLMLQVWVPIVLGAFAILYLLTLPGRNKEKGKLRDIAKSINADKFYGYMYATFVGAYNGIKYKVIYRRPQSARCYSSPGKLFIYLYSSKERSGLKLFIISKCDWPKQGILTVLTLKKFCVGQPDLANTYIIRTNNKDEAGRILLSDDKRKALISLCEQGFEIELSKKYICLGRELNTFSSGDIIFEKDCIIKVLSKSSELCQKLGY